MDIIIKTKIDLKMSFDIERIMITPDLLYYDYPINYISSMIKDGHINKDVIILILVFKDGMNMELVGYVGIEKAINEIGILR